MIDEELNVALGKFLETNNKLIKETNNVCDKIIGSPLNINIITSTGFECIFSIMKVWYSNNCNNDETDRALICQERDSIKNFIKDPNSKVFKFIIYNCN